MNNVVLIGRATRDVELRCIQSGTAVANFNIAVDKGLSKAKREEFEQQGKPTADFINIVVWGNSAEYVANYLKKGKMVAVQGSIETGRYEDKDGKTVYTTDVNAFRVKILEWQDSKYQNEGGDNGSMDFHPVENTDIPF